VVDSQRVQTLFRRGALRVLHGHIHGSKRQPIKRAKITYKIKDEYLGYHRVLVRGVGAMVLDVSDVKHYDTEGFVAYFNHHGVDEGNEPLGRVQLNPVIFLHVCVV
jgi:hypothetical protein